MNDRDSGGSVVCTRCGARHPVDFRFCPACGEPLQQSPARADERRVVTTLFCDIVGYTQLTDQADAEDVDRLLRGFAAMARGIVESHGGVVEKYIGDAVVAVFGVPAVHEDDPERAVRAALRITEAAANLPAPAGQPVLVRAGVSTGETLVHLDQQPGSGEGFLTGDSLNVASRLQGVAPPGGVVVSDLTHSLSSGSFDYDPLGPLSLRGKSKPIDAWLAKAPRSWTPLDVSRSAPFVGRKAELAFLRAAVDDAIVTSSPRMVLVEGEPGIGKSRLVRELAARLDAGTRFVRWRQSPCLPYGEDSAFGPLREIVKAEADIFDNDNASSVEEKLALIVPSGEDGEWMARRLRPLLGLEASQATREENFGAWLRFLEHLATTHPTVIVFEDLHWADVAMLAFLDYIGAEIAAVPLVVLCTTRPELADTAPAFWLQAGGRGRLTLERLSDDQTAELVSSLAVERSLSAEETGMVADRASGNPFYAEELARLVAGGTIEDARDSLRVDGVIASPLPASIQAIIAARLDTLAPSHKRMLGDAAVLGAEFWSGGVAELGAVDVASVTEALSTLVDKGLVVRKPVSAIEGETEFTFCHHLLREVAYNQLPRAVRAERHAASAKWIESQTGDSSDDVAEALAHHYVAALELARAASDEGLSGAIVQPAIRALTRAGDRALPLDVVAAERHYARAVALAGPAAPQRPALLAAWGEALRQSGRYAEAHDALEEGAAGLVAAGDVRNGAVALTRLACVLQPSDSRAEARVSQRALTLLDQDEEASPELVEVLENWAGVCMRAFQRQASIETADRAIAMSRRLGLPTPVRALGYRAVARCELGDESGLDDFRTALAAAQAQSLGREIGALYNNIACYLSVMEGLEPAVSACRAGLEFAQRRADRASCAFLYDELVESLLIAGWWEMAGHEAETADRLLSDTGALNDLQHLRSTRALLLAWQGEFDAGAPLATWAVEANAGVDAPFIRPACLISLASVQCGRGNNAAGRRLLEECRGLDMRVRGKDDYVLRLPEAMRLAISVGDPGLAQSLARGIPRSWKYSSYALMVAEALVSEAEGDRATAASAYSAAAVGWSQMGVPFEEAHARLGLGRCLLAVEQGSEGERALHGAADLFARLGATPSLAQARSLLE